MRIEVDKRIAAELGEGPIWDAATNELLTVDMISGTVAHTSFAFPAAASSQQTVSDYVGAVLPADVPGVVVVTRADLKLASTNGTKTLVRVIEDTEKRLNDAACDARGRVWVGSTHVDVREGEGSLHVWEPGGPPAIAASTLTLPNGIGWSPQNDVIYVADSGQSSVLRGTFDLESGHIGRLTTLFTVDRGEPDGLCVDADGSLWIAIWDGHRVEHRAPDGELLDTVDLPVTRPTSCALIPGIGLAITTARFGLNSETLSEENAAGHLLIARSEGNSLPTARVRTS
ncbi:SMP-30/gluconolactonase/LRE family protein [Microbacterium sp. MPKO10]|uniref:SMP-30/gluconolactonase/LRE family protein n=1 Tax=Microbacterium sp. MPKO10 TaxID=2989818 RepID=UPI00223582C3|nr:SMP-30/gluconolactonase/LRE family protein [Microbacterium sp. MPKO10]MCW4457677.1 SMP-30/gluconolactonase/LRE family protein [Microbacterium sp. MPKO10]